MVSPDLEQIEIDNEQETDVLVERLNLKSWTTLDKLLLVFGVVVNLGDGVEIYLPGSLSNTIISRSLAWYVEFICTETLLFFEKSWLSGDPQSLFRCNYISH